MKKIIFAFALLAYSFTIVSCGDDDKNDDINITYSELPAEAQKFVEKHFADFNDTQISHVEKDNDGTYSLVFKNRIEIDFYPNGDWKDIDLNNNALPESIALLIPKNALSYISQKYPAIAIEEIEKKGTQSANQGFMIELKGDIDVYFDGLGNVTNDKGNTNSGNQTIPADNLPESIKSFMNQHFKGETPSEIKLEWDKYEITYNKDAANEVELEFLKDETFKSIEAEGSDLVIRNIIANMSPTILNYIDTNHKGFAIKNFAKTPSYLGGNLKDGYNAEIELGETEYDIYFDKNGNHVKTIID